jgi:hypothetical protein
MTGDAQTPDGGSLRPNTHDLSSEVLAARDQIQRQRHTIWALVAALRASQQG